VSEIFQPLLLNYRNLLIGFQVTAKNVGAAFLGHSVDKILSKVWPRIGKNGPKSTLNS